VLLASLLFYQLAGVPPLLHRTTSIGPLLLPLVALTLSYFALNTLFVYVAVWLETGGSLGAMLRQHLPVVALDFSVSMSLVVALVQSSGDLTVWALVILLPMLLASYVSSHHTASRLEDTDRHLSELRRLYESTVETLAMAIDAKDQVTHGHIRRVQVLSTRLAEALGATAGERQALEAAALLHDLGKLAVPEHILNKPGRLNPAEFEEMKKHADVGASILSAIEFPFPVVPIVRHHHEHWDGSGYPDGLCGTAIPLGARILAVVDCYDALTSDRPYRRRMTHEDALQIIRSRRGTAYDPAVVDAFVRLHQAGQMEPEPVRGTVTELLRDTAPAKRERPLVRPRLAPRPAEDCRDRVRQFLATLHAAEWADAGRAVAAFVPAAIPDSVAVLFRPDADVHRLVVAGLDRDIDARIPESIPIGTGVTGWVAATRQSMANVDAELDLGDIAGITSPPLRLCVSVPVLDDGEVAAVLTVYSPYAFSEVQQQLIGSLAEALPSAVEARPEGAFAAAAGSSLAVH
jgi:putative nucleotidyltransferase with HDIG domain